MYVVIDPKDSDFFGLDTLPKVFQGADDRISKCMELIVDRRVCHRDPKPRQEPVDETVGVA